MSKRENQEEDELRNDDDIYDDDNYEDEDYDFESFEDGDNSTRNTSRDIQAVVDGQEEHKQEKASISKKDSKGVRDIDLRKSSGLVSPENINNLKDSINHGDIVVTGDKRGAFGALGSTNDFDSRESLIANASEMYDENSEFLESSGGNNGRSNFASQADQEDDFYADDEEEDEDEAMGDHTVAPDGEGRTKSVDKGNSLSVAVSDADEYEDDAGGEEEEENENEIEIEGMDLEAYMTTVMPSPEKAPVNPPLDDDHTSADESNSFSLTKVDPMFRGLDGMSPGPGQSRARVAASPSDNLPYHPTYHDPTSDFPDRPSEGVEHLDTTEIMPDEEDAYGFGEAVSAPEDAFAGSREDNLSEGRDRGSVAASRARVISAPGSESETKSPTSPVVIASSSPARAVVHSPIAVIPPNTEISEVGIGDGVEEEEGEEEGGAFITGIVGQPQHQRLSSHVVVEEEEEEEGEEYSTGVGTKFAIVTAHGRSPTPPRKSKDSSPVAAAPPSFRLSPRKAHGGSRKDVIEEGEESQPQLSHRSSAVVTPVSHAVDGGEGAEGGLVPRAAFNTILEQMARLQAQLDSLVSKEDNRRVREQREAVTETEKDVQSLSPAPASELSVETNQRSALVHQQKHMLSVEALLQGIDLKALSSGAGSRMAAGKSHLHQPTHQHKSSGTRSRLNFAHAAAKDILRAANGPSGGQSQGQGQGQSSPVPSRNGGGASVSVAQEGGSVVEPGLSAEEQVIQLKRELKKRDERLAREAEQAAVLASACIDLKKQVSYLQKLVRGAEAELLAKDMRGHDRVRRKDVSSSVDGKQKGNKGRILALEERVEQLNKALHESRSHETDLEEQVLSLTERNDALTAQLKQSLMRELRLRADRLTAVGKSNVAVSKTAGADLGSVDGSRKPLGSAPPVNADRKVSLKRAGLPPKVPVSQDVGSVTGAGGGVFKVKEKDGSRWPRKLSNGRSVEDRAPSHMPALPLIG